MKQETAVWVECKMVEVEDAECTRGYYDNTREKQNYLEERTAGRKKEGSVKEDTEV